MALRVHLLGMARGGDDARRATAALLVAAVGLELLWITVLAYVLYRVLN